MHVRSRVTTAMTILHRTSFSAPVRRLAIALASTVFAAGMAVGTSSATPVAAATVIHVSPTGDDAAAGTSAAPVRTVQQAVRLADPGASIEIAAGRYHESVQVYAKQVHLSAAPGATVVFDGAIDIDTWTPQAGRWWAPWSTDFERSGAPFTTDARPEAGWPEQFFVDDRNLREVASVAAVVPGTFYYDRNVDRVWIADDPTGRDVAGSALNWGLYLNKADGSSVSGVTVERYATQTRNMAAVRAYADDLVLEDLIVRDNARMGVSVIGDRVRVERVDAVGNGHLGLHAHRTTELLISGAYVSGNNHEEFDAFHSAGGIKATETKGFVVEKSTVVDNAGPGVWSDLDASDVVIVSNWIAGNTRSGVEVELSSDVIVADNTIHDNGEAGVWVLESQRVDVWHNSLLRNVRDVWVLHGPRADVNDVTIGNNLLGGDGGPEAEPAIVNVDDWTEQRSAADMNVQLDANRFWLVPGARTTAVSRWADWPQPLAVSSTIAAHRTATGQGAGSDLVVSSRNPFSRSSADSRQLEGARPGSTPPIHVARILGGPPGPQPAGPLTASVGRGGVAQPVPDAQLADSQPADPRVPEPQPNLAAEASNPPAPDASVAITPTEIVELGQVANGANAGATRGSMAGIGTASRFGALFVSA